MLNKEASQEVTEETTLHPFLLQLLKTSFFFFFACHYKLCQYLTQTLTGCWWGEATGGDTLVSTLQHRGRSKEKDIK